MSVNTNCVTKTSCIVLILLKNIILLKVFVEWHWYGLACDESINKDNEYSPVSTRRIGHNKRRIKNPSKYLR